MEAHLDRVVRAIRKTNKVNQEEFSQLLKVSQGTISKVEAGMLDLSCDGLLFLMTEFKIRPEVLMYGYIELDYVPNIKKSGFRIKESYKHLMRYTSKNIAMLRLACEMTFDEFGKLVKDNLTVDPDMFTILNHPIGEYLMEDISTLVRPRMMAKKISMESMLKVDPELNCERGTLEFINRFLAKSNEYLDIDYNIEENNTERLVFNYESTNEVLHQCAKLAFKSINGKLKVKTKKIDALTEQVIYSA
jgi:transcriptional regulator with XRE-family HTH domain